ncbi:monocarboxylate transporter 12-like isoform X2 [Littorina saxatilis]
MNGSSNNAPSLDELRSNSKDDQVNVIAGEEVDEENKMMVDNNEDTVHSGLPVDRGWAWVIMTAQFVLTFLMVGYGRALSMFFLEFIDLFQVSVTMATVTLGIMTAFFGVGNVVVSNALLPRMEARTIVLIGTITSTVFVALSSLATSIVFIIITHCFISFSHALMYIPSVTLLGHYFNTRRSFAMSVANCGVSVSALVFPPLTQHLITSFGARGALLLVAGLQMQAVIAATLLRPVSFYERKKGVETRKESPTELENHEAVKSAHEGTESGSNLDVQKATTRLLGDSDRPEVGDSVAWKKSTDFEIEKLLLSTSVPEKSIFSSSDPERFSSVEVLNVQNTHLNGVAANRNYARQHSCPHNSHTGSGVHHRVTAEPLNKTSVYSTSLVDVCGSAVDISVTVLPLSDPDTDTDSDDGKGIDNRGCCRKGLSVVLSIFDVALFRNWMFRLIVTYVPLGLMAGFIGFYFPSLGVGQGLPRPQAALLLTVVGGVDLCSRLVLGYLADLNKVKRTHIVILCMTVLGIAAQFCRFYTNFGLLAMFAVIYGLFGGACQNLFAVVIIDLLGLANLGKVMGLVLLLNSVSASLMHPVIGAMVDLSGTFVVPFNFVGGCLFLSAGILLLEPFANRLEKKRLQRLDKDDTSDKSGPLAI